MVNMCGMEIKLLSEQLEKYIGRISPQEQEALLRYDIACMKDAVTALRRLETLRRSKVRTTQ